MVPNEFWLTAPSGERISGWRLIPHIVPRAIVCLVHGFGEHSRRYLHWANRFVAYEYGFVGFDLIGHGRSEGKRGHIGAIEQHLDCMDRVIQSAIAGYPGIPVVLYGHSMGGNLILNYALRRCCMVHLLVATSPWLRLTNPPALPLRVAAWALEKLAPTITLAAGVKAQHLSQLDEVVKRYQADPLVHGQISPRQLLEMQRGGEYVLRHGSAINLPLLLMHGSSDRITSFAASSELAQRAPQCSFIPWRGMFHELHHETVAQGVFMMIQEWISGNLEGNEAI